MSSNGNGVHRIADARVADRVSQFPESVIREMSRVAAKDGAINLAQGFPDFEPPEALKEAAKRALDGGFNQYAITWGSPRLREALSKKLAAKNGIAATADDHITVTCGATEAMMASLLAVVNPGDEVVLFEPFYENFGPDAIVAGAKTRFVPLEGPDFDFDDEALKAAFTPKTKAVVINTPGNPTGQIIPKDRLRAITDLCVDRDALAVTDEIYEELVYDGLRHTSPATLPGMAERTISIFGFSKTYSVTGWRLGYTVAPKPLTDAIRRVHDFLTVGAPAPLQEAAVSALALPPSYYDELRADYTRRRDVLLRGLERVGFDCYRPNAAYYILADFSRLSDLDDAAFARWLSREARVAPVPGSSFFHDKRRGRSLVRFAFPKKIPTLEEAVKRLESRLLLGKVVAA
ncbi:MAG: aminotransferase class I/II-fold pyridoxal phosphate-dependent enzyme [Euryarchaeota archaeon]|nr:aminotransferase class I/II-fold pyridoxal phosphate-dependent enzyme [Euryarchaeota archaeon]